MKYFVIEYMDYNTNTIKYVKLNDKEKIEKRDTRIVNYTGVEDVLNATFYTNQEIADNNRKFILEKEAIVKEVVITLKVA